MKKSLFFVAAAALALTACTSENDVVQTASQQQQSGPKAVGFDVYTQGATDVTRAGLQGTMTTSRMQRSEADGGGFGVYAFYTDYRTGATSGKADYAAYIDASKVPNFMVNEKILWNATNLGWYYSPLKYWPNETTNDSQTSPALMEDGTNKATDKLTFFAYAPYVEQGAIDFGITGVTAKDGTLTPEGKLDAPGTANTTARAADEPSVSYRASLADPNKAVDLLWGVAPAGGLTYTAVNGTAINKSEGLPLIDMVKPDVNTNMKFLFQHALARIGVKAVAAIDQVGAGGKLDRNTKITIKKITLEGYFGETGVLNLNNPIENVANWVNVNGKTLSGVTDPSTGLTKKTITIEGAQIADHVKYKAGDDPGYPTNIVAQPVAGVTTVKQDVLAPVDVYGSGTDLTSRHCYTTVAAAGKLAYSETTPYYTDAICSDPATIEIAANSSYTIDSKGIYTEQTAKVEGFKYPNELKYYAKGAWYEVVADNTTPTGNQIRLKDCAGCKAYTKNASPEYYKPKSGDLAVGDYVIWNATNESEGILFYQMTSDNKASFAGEQAYTISSSTYTPEANGTALKAIDHYVICGSLNKFVPKYGQETLYKRDANFFMVVPTNNIYNLGTYDETEEKALRTVTVTIEYYITTEDANLNQQRSQIRNVITKDVVFPSIANGKSYNLNLVLGLTSVKFEAEVDDWKVVNVNGDLPQNTAD